MGTWFPAKHLMMIFKLPQHKLQSCCAPAYCAHQAQLTHTALQKVCEFSGGGGPHLHQSSCTSRLSQQTVKVAKSAGLADSEAPPLLWPMHCTQCGHSKWLRLMKDTKQDLLSYRQDCLGVLTLHKNLFLALTALFEHLPLLNALWHSSRVQSTQTVGLRCCFIIFILLLLSKEELSEMCSIPSEISPIPCHVHLHFIFFFFTSFLSHPRFLPCFPFLSAPICPAPCIMSLIHQPDSINRIPIAVCSLGARCCLCLYESITPAHTSTPPVTDSVCAFLHVWILKPAQHYDHIYCRLCLEECPKHTQDADTDTHTTAKMTTAGHDARPLGYHKLLAGDIISFSCLPLTLPYNNK